MNKEKVLEFAEKSYIDWYPYSDCTEKHLERFAELIEEEVRVTIKGEQKLIKQLVEALQSTEMFLDYIYNPKNKPSSFNLLMQQIIIVEQALAAAEEVGL